MDTPTLDVTKHKAEIVEIKELNDDQVAYRVVCCGEQCRLKDGVDPSIICTYDSHQCHDHWITLSLSIDDHEKQLNDFKADVKNRHERKLQWRKKQQEKSCNPSGQ